jgi:hypothetical protein
LAFLTRQVGAKKLGGFASAVKSNTGGLTSKLGGTIEKQGFLTFKAKKSKLENISQSLERYGFLL